MANTRKYKWRKRRWWEWPCAIAVVFIIDSIPLLLILWAYITLTGG